MRRFGFVVALSLMILGAPLRASAQTLSAAVPGVVVVTLMPIYGWPAIFVVGSIVPFVIGPVQGQQTSNQVVNGPVPGQQTSNPHGSICEMIESAAHANGLPVNFFVRLIWQESHLRPEEVGPLTRSGERAQGIAQFMPGTAVDRRLFEPFNPAEALPKASEWLAELRDQFGNLGLAAAAYNAGPARVREFISGGRNLPAETRNYVLVITGRSIEYWKDPA